MRLTTKQRDTLAEAALAPIKTKGRRSPHHERLEARGLLRQAGTCTIPEREYRAKRQGMEPEWTTRNYRGLRWVITPEGEEALLTTSGLPAAQVVIRWNDDNTRAYFRFLAPENVVDRVTGERPTRYFARVDVLGPAWDPTHYRLTRQARSKHARRQESFPAADYGKMCERVTSWVARNFAIKERD